MNKDIFNILSSQIEAVLCEQLETRNSDKLLTINIWKRFYSHLFVGGCIPPEVVMDLPAQASVQRIRALIQNTKKLYPPTNWKIAKRRGWQEDEWKRSLGYYVENRGQWKFTFTAK